MKQQHHPYHQRKYLKGANTDVSLDKLGSAESGEYYDAQNMRPNSMDGKRGSLEKIKGESEVYPALEGGVYTNVAAFQVLGRAVEVFASAVPGQYPFIRIDGTTYLKSQNFPANPTVPFQYDIDEKADGGEFCLTDNINPPMVFNVQNMIDELPSLTYFDPLFQVEAYQVTPDTVPDHPVFVELVSLGGDNGLPVGQYSYSFRYVSEAGDRTNWSAPTPLLFVPQFYSPRSPQYPGSLTMGAAAGEKTQWSNKIKFRVNNKYNFESIEIRRTNYNSGMFIGHVPYSYIVGRIHIEKGQFNVVDFVDDPDNFTPEPITEEEEFNSITKIEAAKAVRYFNNRLYLMNVEYRTRDIDSEVTFRTEAGDEMFPVLSRMTKDGMNDPWTHAYKRPYMRGEKYGWAAIFFDGNGGASYALPIPNFENFQVPNRRDPSTSYNAASAVYSEDGLVHAADVFGNFPGTQPQRNAEGVNIYGNTFEAFDFCYDSRSPEYNPERKTDLASFKNILDKGSVLTFRVNAFAPSRVPDVDGTAGVFYAKDIGYNPFRPVSDNDRERNGHSYQQIVGADGLDYQPYGYAPNYYAIGQALAGMTGIPSWAKSFSIVRTKPAGRVICQGIGMYKFKKNDKYEYNHKDLDKLFFHSPDITAGLVDPEDIKRRVANGTLKLQFVSPLGFFSEPFSFDNDSSLSFPLGQKDGGIDIMSYARILYDSKSTDENGFNPLFGTVADNVGYDPTTGAASQYVRHGSWRNPFVANSAFDENNYTNPADGLGNQYFSVTDFNLGHPSLNVSQGTMSSVSLMGRGLGENEYYEIGVSSDGTDAGLPSPVPSGLGIYSKGSTATNYDYTDADVRDFHEPFYIINLIDDGADVVTADNSEYHYTGCYVKIEGEIGLSNGEFLQEFPLIDERWEDCIPAFSTTKDNEKGNPERYIWVRKTDGTDEKWENVTFRGGAYITALKAQIDALTTDVRGMYTHKGTPKNPVVVFDVETGGTQYIPDNGATIIVKYDPEAPVAVYGGDACLGESIFAPIDLELLANGNEARDRFRLDMGWPFRYWAFNPRYFIVNKPSGANKIQDGLTCAMKWLRQMCIMYTVESRVNTNLMFNSTAPFQSFPSINYVMRPYKWEDGDGSAADERRKHINPEYFEDYPDEDKYWGWGGIRFLPNRNMDYSHGDLLNTYFRKPSFGFHDNARYPDMVTWSLRRPQNAYDAPGSRTFLWLNRKEISDDNGEIKFAWDTLSGQGDNLYAITETGICLLLTDQSILRGSAGEQVALYATDSQGVQGEFWISREIGLNDEMWRSCAEHENVLYFMNSRSAFAFNGQEYKDIGVAANYHRKLRSDFLGDIILSDKVSGAFDVLHKEYIVQFWKTRVDPDTGLDFLTQKAAVFNLITQGFNGEYTYQFDNMYSIDNRFFGVKNQKTYELGIGDVLNGGNIEGFAIGVSAPVPLGMEFIRIRVNSNNKPTSIEFFYDAEDFNSPVAVMDAGLGALYLKDYDGFEQYIPRETAGDRNRVQGRVLLYKIIHNLAEEFAIDDTIVQYKVLK